MQTPRPNRHPDNPRSAPRFRGPLPLCDLKRPVILDVRDPVQKESARSVPGREASGVEPGGNSQPKAGQHTPEEGEKEQGSNFGDAPDPTDKTVPDAAITSRS